MNPLRLSAQLGLLFVFVVATVATSPARDPFLEPPGFWVSVMPPPVDDVVTVPRNGRFFAMRELQATATLATSSPVDGGVVDAGTEDAGVDVDVEEIVLTATRELPFEWIAYDVSDLRVDTPYTVQLSDGEPVDASNTMTLQVVRTSTDDVTPPTIDAALVVDAVLFQEGAPGEAEPAVSIDPNTEAGPFQRCALSLDFYVADVADEHLAFIDVVKDGRVMNRSVIPTMSDLPPLQLWLPGESLPRGESCYQVVVRDLAGNEGATDEVCFVADGVDACE